ncbi:MAG: hypothetical protein J2O44_08205, partial [Porphyrobacter sp.]|nr:hypothetical protein [Porphyrobacter sp.]
TGGTSAIALSTAYLFPPAPLQSERAPTATVQATSKATGVTVNKTAARITMNNAALAAGASVSFTLSNVTIEAGDLVVVVHESGGTLGAYVVQGAAADGSATITVTNRSAGALSEAIVLFVRIIKTNGYGAVFNVLPPMAPGTSLAVEFERLGTKVRVASVLHQPV